MTYQPTAISDDLSNLPQLLGWVTSGRAETLETVAFRSGAALTVLDQLVSDPRYGVPVKLLANRQALRAATVTSKLEGRLAREADIRDAYHLTPPGEARGPDGDLLAFWRESSRVRPGGTGEIADLVGAEYAGEVGVWLDVGLERARTHGPLSGCVATLRAVLEADGRAERTACLFSDVVLARALNWKVVLPVSAQHLTKTVLREGMPDGGMGHAKSSRSKLSAKAAASVSASSVGSIGNRPSRRTLPKRQIVASLSSTGSPMKATPCTATPRARSASIVSSEWLIEPSAVRATTMVGSPQRANISA